MRVPYEYAVIQAVPRIERGELINVGVLLYCQRYDFLQARTHLDADRLRALDPGADAAAIGATLRSWEDTCRGAGEVLCGSSLDLGALRLDLAFMRWHAEGVTGVGRYDILRKA